MKKFDCIEALADGTNQCEQGSGYSHGLAASIGCMDYIIDLSGVTQDISPPWGQKVAFPPSEDAEKPSGGQHDAVYQFREFMVRENSLPDNELNNAIDHFCQNGAEIVGFGSKKPLVDKMFAWPLNGDPKFFMGAILNGEPVPTVNDKLNWKPYKDMNWCDGYDWKMGKDDCTFALRKIQKECTYDRYLTQADYTYRCVRYNYAYPILEEGAWMI